MHFDVYIHQWLGTETLLFCGMAHTEGQAGSEAANTHPPQPGYKAEKASVTTEMMSSDTTYKGGELRWKVSSTAEEAGRGGRWQKKIKARPENRLSRRLVRAELDLHNVSELSQYSICEGIIEGKIFYWRYTGPIHWHNFYSKYTRPKIKIIYVNMY